MTAQNDTNSQQYPNLPTRTESTGSCFRFVRVYQRLDMRTILRVLHGREDTCWGWYFSLLKYTWIHPRNIQKLPIWIYIIYSSSATNGKWVSPRRPWARSIGLASWFSWSASFVLPAATWTQFAPRPMFHMSLGTWHSSYYLYIVLFEPRWHAVCLYHFFSLPVASSISGPSNFEAFRPWPESCPDITRKKVGACMPKLKLQSG